jgi:hypothetical protein
MTNRLRPRALSLPGGCRLLLEPDTARPERYLVRFCGLPHDRAALAAVESVRVRLMMAHQRGEGPYPYPLPERITIGWIDRQGWHLGRSPYAEPIAAMAAVQECLDGLLGDLMLRVALVAAAAERRLARED